MYPTQGLSTRTAPVIVWDTPLISGKGWFIIEVEKPAELVGGRINAEKKRGFWVLAGNTVDIPFAHIRDR